LAIEKLNSVNKKMLKILFTYPEALPHETLLLQNLMQDDWDFLHVRKPDYSKEEMINYLELISPFHHKVVLHSHYELINEFEVAGINITTKAMARVSYEEELTSSCDIRELCVDADRLTVYGAVPDLVTYSAHGFSEIQHLPFKTDYVFLSPIFDSISKVGYQSVFNDAYIFKAFLKEKQRKVAALGGVVNSKLQIIK